jgi:hypothetical protein
MTILTVLLLDISKSVWGFGKLKLNEENSPASCFPVFSIARALHYTTVPPLKEDTKFVTCCSETTSPKNLSDFKLFLLHYNLFNQ